MRFEASGPVLDDGLKIQVSGSAPQQNASCETVGEENRRITVSFARAKGAPIDTGCGVPDAQRLSLTERTKNWGAITMFVPLENWLPYVKTWPGLQLNAEGRPVGALQDSIGGTIPAFETDEAGVGIWWYWLSERKGFVANGVPNAGPTLRQIAAGIAGEDASEAALNAHLEAYPRLSAQYFEKPLSVDDSIDLTDPEMLWALGQTMFHHESGRTPLIDEATFTRGIHLGTDVMKDTFNNIKSYQAECHGGTTPPRVDGITPAGEILALGDALARIDGLEKRINAVEAENLATSQANAQLAELVGDLQSRLLKISELAHP